MSEERLQKILSRAGVASRRGAEEMIREGRVTVNGRVAELGQSADPDADAIKVDGKRVEPRTAHLYYLLNKPDGYVSTRSDPEGRPTVMDLVPPGLKKLLVPVGRLDFHTEGLLLLTDDGDLAHRVAHPRFGGSKLYEVKVKGEPAEKDVDRLREGIVLEGRRTRPAVVRRVKAAQGPRQATDNTWWTIELHEGRTRQIREMFFRIGHPVIRLRRVAIGPLRDPHLPVGQMRELAPAEVEALRESTLPGGTGGGKGKKRSKAGWAKPKAKRKPKGKGRSKGKPKPGPNSKKEPR